MRSASDGSGPSVIDVALTVTKRHVATWLVLRALQERFKFRLRQTILPRKIFYILAMRLSIDCPEITFVWIQETNDETIMWKSGEMYLTTFQYSHTVDCNLCRELQIYFFLFSLFIQLKKLSIFIRRKYVCARLFSLTPFIAWTRGIVTVCTSTSIRARFSDLSFSTELPLIVNVHGVASRCVAHFEEAPWWSHYVV